MKLLKENVQYNISMVLVWSCEYFISPKVILCATLLQLICNSTYKISGDKFFDGYQLGMVDANDHFSKSPNFKYLTGF